MQDVVKISHLWTFMPSPSSFCLSCTNASYNLSIIIRLLSRQSGATANSSDYSQNISFHSPLRSDYFSLIFLHVCNPCNSDENIHLHITLMFNFNGTSIFSLCFSNKNVRQAIPQPLVTSIINGLWQKMFWPKFM